LADLLATTAVTYESGAFCPALGRWGDLDKDKAANSRDALAILSNLVGIEVGASFNLAMGDVDGDGKVNSRDALIILSYAVGIDIPGQRVLLVAGGLCSSGSVPEVVVVPDTVDLVVNQTVRLIALTRDATGQLVARSGLHWEIGDPRLGVVEGDGLLTAREPGTTVVTASLGPGVRAQAPVIVRARRPVWMVDAARAQRNPVQLGTSRWPFSTPQRAFRLVSEGDTIRVAPGVHDYEDCGYYEDCAYYDYYDDRLYAGAVIIGDTLADGTRPVLRARELDYHYGFYWSDGLRGEIRNLVLRGFSTAVYVNGLHTLVLDNVRIEEPRTYYGYGIYAQRMDSLRVDRSEFLSDSLRNSYYGVYLADGARFASVRRSRFTNWGNWAILAYDVDSLDVSESEFLRNYYGVQFGTASNPSVSAHLSRNRFIDHAVNAVYGWGVATLAMDHNYILQKQNYPLRVYGTSELIGAPPLGAPAQRAPAAAVSGTRFTSQGDSIQFRASGYEWLNAQDFDSLLIDSLWLESARDTAIAQYSYLEANVARITNSRLLNLYTEGIDFYGQVLTVDNSEFTGCAQPTCTWSNGYAIQARAAYPDSGPVVTLNNSRFWNLNFALWAAATGDSAGPMHLSGNTADSVSYGFYLASDSVVAQDNVLRKVRLYGIYAQPSFSNRAFKPVVALRNQITCALTSSTSYGIRSDYAPGWFEDNGVTDCEWGLSGYNASPYPLADFTARRNAIATDTTSAVTSYGVRPDGRWRPALYGNRVKNGAYGFYLTTSDTAAMKVDSNAVSGTRSAGVYISASVPVTGVRNNVTNNLLDGILNFGTGARSFRRGRFVGNARYAVNSSPVFDAQQNWWGDTLGVAGASADTVFGNVDVSNHLTDDPADVPPALAAPVLAPAVVQPWTAEASATSPVPVAEPNAADREQRLAERAARQREAAADREARRRMAEEEMARLLRHWAERREQARRRPPQ
ncbi:MAG: right-handed parallel beta-helix repeat-containing protein, partial [Gemmatimonadetes bacterium]|nr:right-handed parallel beta-helix repeat-containing protein [Gemmatimonadota bacterium]